MKSLSPRVLASLRSLYGTQVPPYLVRITSHTLVTANQKHIHLKDLLHEGVTALTMYLPYNQALQTPVFTLVSQHGLYKGLGLDGMG